MMMPMLDIHRRSIRAYNRTVNYLQLIFCFAVFPGFVLRTFTMITVPYGSLEWSELLLSLESWFTVLTKDGRRIIQLSQLEIKHPHYRT